MYNKLTDEKIEHLLEIGIDEFAQLGMSRANINVIAKKAGISVGVIYKYFTDKHHFFLACVEYSLRLLDTAMQDVTNNEEDVISCIRLLVRDLMDGAKKHPNYFVMYNEITSGSCREYAKELARDIEENTAAVYGKLIEKAQSEGRMKREGNPHMFAFFFDNLLMSLQFAFSCSYYNERMKIFCGENVMEHPEKLVDEFVLFMTGALGIAEQGQNA